MPHEDEDFGYSGAPSSDDKVGWVRFNVGDTDPDDYLLTDSEIEFHLDRASDSVNRATANCCVAMMAKLAQEVDHKAGKVSYKSSQKFKMLEELEKKYRKAGGGDDLGTGKPNPCIRVGGTRHSENRALDQDKDRISPEFRVGMNDNPRTRHKTEPRPDRDDY